MRLFQERLPCICQECDKFGRLQNQVKGKHCSEQKHPVILSLFFFVYINGEPICKGEETELAFWLAAHLLLLQGKCSLGSFQRKKTLFCCFLICFQSCYLNSWHCWGLLHIQPCAVLCIFSLATAASFPACSKMKTLIQRFSPGKFLHV